jgi:hypothetical protein
LQPPLTTDYLPIATLLAAVAGGVLAFVTAMATNRWTASREDRFRFAEAKRDAYQSFLGEAYAFLRAVGPAFWAAARDGRFGYEGSADRRVVEQAHGLATRSLTTVGLLESLTLAALLESEAPRPEAVAPSLVQVVAAHTRLAFLAPTETLQESDLVVTAVIRIRQAFDNPSSVMAGDEEDRIDFLVSNALGRLDAFRLAARRDAGAIDAGPGLLGRLRARVSAGAVYTGQLRPFFDARPTVPLRCHRCADPIESIEEGKVRWQTRNEDQFQYNFQIVHRDHREDERRGDPWTLSDFDLTSICRPSGLEDFVFSVTGHQTGRTGWQPASIAQSHDGPSVRSAQTHGWKRLSQPSPEGGDDMYPSASMTMRPLPNARDPQAHTQAGERHSSRQRRSAPLKPVSATPFVPRPGLAKPPLLGPEPSSRPVWRPGNRILSGAPFRARRGQRRQPGREPLRLPLQLG